MNYPEDWFRQRYHQIKAGFACKNTTLTGLYGFYKLLIYRAYIEFSVVFLHAIIGGDELVIKSNLLPNFPLNGSSRWQARITFRCKEIYLGTYDTKIEAKAALKAAAKMREVIYNDIQ